MSSSDAEIDRTYSVPLSRAWIAPRYRRTTRAINVLREFAERHMKSSEIKIDSELNEKLWSRGITRPPRRITVRMIKDEDGLVTISLPKAEATVENAEPEAPPGDERPEEEKAQLVESENTVASSKEKPHQEPSAKERKNVVSKKSAKKRQTKKN